MSKESDGQMKKLMKQSKQKWDSDEKKLEKEQNKNDPLAGRSPAFRRLVSCAMLGSLITDSINIVKKK